MARKSKRNINPNENTKSEPPVLAFNATMYLRISKEDKFNNSIMNQECIILSYIAQSSDIVPYETYIDNGFSSFGETRPAFHRMMNDIEKKEINCVIVKDVSRFGRDYIETGDYIEQIFPAMGVRFISILDNYDSLTGSVNDMGISWKNLVSYYYSITQLCILLYAVSSL